MGQLWPLSVNKSTTTNTSLNWANIGSDNGLSPGRRQTIIWTNARIWIIGPLGKNFSEILIEIRAFSFNEMHLKMSSAKWRPFCPGRDELNGYAAWDVMVTCDLNAF